MASSRSILRNLALTQLPACWLLSMCAQRARAVVSRHRGQHVFRRTGVQGVIDFLHEHDVASELPRIAMSCPAILATLAERDLRPVVAFLRDRLSLDAAEASAALRRAPQLLAPWAAARVAHNVALFEECASGLLSARIASAQ
jgi:hypothetical protein